ncbi:hypothetical protein ACWOE5_01470 [Aerococcus sanguinicola]|uniref:DUF3188 domain-containing protein n=1 Tax=Aerococcus sanguinicola TaxID=119206 RepID=A0A120I9G5_9LACT|nr:MULTISPECIES: hypothetical protein [Aerococcus]AMB94839.1 hypothetical protein AWM72_08745 [Aerococcus sanguinicola]MDK7049613.1 hypothetical protein [Aerococcus sanguinicola]OFT95977.1 hypothetical protein HMPREF3090_03080 [Aerococcus sp. HMSC23C02]PKZ23157.1 hypothetical protein CYJ28_01005 [Aerococcus sanguinicola]
MKNKYHAFVLVIVLGLLIFGSPFFQDKIVNFIFGLIVILASGGLMILAEGDIRNTNRKN